MAERAAAARAVMLQRDREDRAALKELRKQQRQEKRVGWGPLLWVCKWEDEGLAMKELRKQQR